MKETPWAGERPSEISIGWSVPLHIWEAMMWLALWEGWYLSHQTKSPGFSHAIAGVRHRSPPPYIPAPQHAVFPTVNPALSECKRLHRGQDRRNSHVLWPRNVREGWIKAFHPFSTSTVVDFKHWLSNWSVCEWTTNHARTMIHLGGIIGSVWKG